MPPRLSSLASTKPNPEGFGRVRTAIKLRSVGRSASTKPNPEGFGRSERTQRPTDRAIAASTKPNPEGFGRRTITMAIRSGGYQLQRSQTPKGLEGARPGGDVRRTVRASTKPNPEGFGRSTIAAPRRELNHGLQRSQTPKGLEGRRSSRSDVGIARRFNEAKPRRVWKDADARGTTVRASSASTKPNPEGFGRHVRDAELIRNRTQLQRSQTPKGLEGEAVGRRWTGYRSSFNEAKPRRVWKVQRRRQVE